MNLPSAVPHRDPEAVLRFIESFASVLGEGGFPPMPARVFAALLATNSGRLTAADLADLLRVSPAAVSGAIRYLLPLNLLSRERDPGSRRGVYRVHDDVWHAAILRREQVMRRWEIRLREGIDVLGAASPAGVRLAETLAFFEFVQEEMPPMLERWRSRRAARPAG